MTEASLQYAVSLAKPSKLEEAYEAAWKAHLGPHAPWKQYVDQAEERIASKVHKELETFSQQTGQFITRTNAEFLQKHQGPPESVKPSPVTSM